MNTISQFPKIHVCRSKLGDNISQIHENSKDWMLDDDHHYNQACVGIVPWSIQLLYFESQNSGVPQEWRYFNLFDLLMKMERRSACRNMQKVLFGQAPFESFNGSSNAALDFSLLIDFWRHSRPPFICFLYQLQMSPTKRKTKCCS